MSLTTVLIANRGEIALRVIRGCRDLGLRSVAIYTDLDRDAPHVREADDAVPVASYLDIDAVVAAAREAGADAIHPGYGFLSERSAFARAVESAGLKLVGPSAEVMDRMGRKDAAREIAVAAGVPVVPHGRRRCQKLAGSRSSSRPPPVAAARACGSSAPPTSTTRRSPRRSARRPRRSATTPSWSRGTSSTAATSRCRCWPTRHGNVVHLFERDCSTQRRHQKVLEEAPAPTISPEVRKLVTESAVALAAHVGYENAGTVEFLLDADTDEAYFLEMNTRLQVEHPVTELAVQIRGEGLDLVQLQLRVAAGEPLPFGQDDVTVSGHAIEARVYAEDPFHDFLPQAGTASIVRWPARARVDAALESGSIVSTAYDPMLGKVIVHGPDRESARRALVAALDDTAILGLTTNIGFLRALAASDEFRDATIDTAWLDHTTLEPPARTPPRIFAAWTRAMLVDLDQQRSVPLRRLAIRRRSGADRGRARRDPVRSTGPAAGCVTTRATTRSTSCSPSCTRWC